MDESSSSAPNSPHTRFRLVELLPFRFADDSSPEDAGAELPAATFFLSLLESLTPPLPFPVTKWLCAGVVGRDVSGVGTGVESAEVSYNGCCGFGRVRSFGTLSSALSLSVLEGGVSFTFGVVDEAPSLCPSRS
jgi:hypothetical protein